VGDNRLVMGAARRIVAACVIGVMLALLPACGDDHPTKPRSDVPKGFDVPAGVTITEGGATLQLGRAASVVYRVEERAASAITVVVREVVKGSVKNDFTFFSLDDAAKTSTPYYVKVGVRNDGPSGLGGVAIPVLAHTRSNTVFPPSELVGTFKPCPHAALPKSFLKGSKAELCLVFLLPKGERLRTIDLQTGTEADAIHWKP
jgi:hypothetical protein